MMKRTLKMAGGLSLLFALYGPYGITPAHAQYPVIPPVFQQRTDSILELEEARLQAYWEREGKATVERQARAGRPYVPWAAYPLDLVRADIPAFPGAEGGGAFTPGGRGGKVYVVTSLEDNGPGTFREACEAAGARVIVFNVAGIIHLETPVVIQAPYVTIAGQTAPGDGVCIAGETVAIETHDVIIRHMRFRRGNTEVTRRDDALGGDVKGNIIIDHCSVSWGLDENISIYRNMYTDGQGVRHKLPAVNITIQNTISSEALDTYNHAFGSTLGGLNSTFIRNLWAHNISRNPSVGMYGDFTFVNNVLFNWWNRTVDGGDHRSLFNIINNYYKPGPITPTDRPIAHRILKPEADRSRKDSSVYGRAYVAGNVVENNPLVTADNWAGGVQVGSRPDAGDHASLIRADRPFPMASLTIYSAEEAYRYVLRHVGATLPRRDAVDERIIREVATGKLDREQGLEIESTGFVNRRLPSDSYKRGIITDVSQVGGYPEYSGEPYPDTDGDGMPDAWEVRYGLDPHDPSDANGDINGDGYTNIEKFINGIDPAVKVDWTKPENNKDTLEGKSRIFEQ
ncbi:polysaccharide lyase [Parapedobacter composti]|nr:polysaccharide lyase [Parapedobacter composti]